MSVFTLNCCFSLSFSQFLRKFTKIPVERSQYWHKYKPTKKASHHNGQFRLFVLFLRNLLRFAMIEIKLSWDRLHKSKHVSPHILDRALKLRFFSSLFFRVTYVYTLQKTYFNSLPHTGRINFRGQKLWRMTNTHIYRTYMFSSQVTDHHLAFVYSCVYFWAIFFYCSFLAGPKHINKLILCMTNTRMSTQIIILSNNNENWHTLLASQMNLEVFLSVLFILQL